MLQVLRMPFDCPEAAEVNREIFAAIYFGAVTESVQLAREQGPYESFDGSPASEGLLQFDLWEQSPSSRWPWEQLKEDVKKHGLRNSLLLAPM